MLRRGRCVVLSIGSNNEFSFEQAVVEKYGCDVHTFDHTVNSPNAPNGVTFHPYGLGTADEAQAPDSRMVTLAQARATTHVPVLSRAGEDGGCAAAAAGTVAGARDGGRAARRHPKDGH